MCAIEREMNEKEVLDRLAAALSAADIETLVAVAVSMEGCDEVNVDTFILVHAELQMRNRKAYAAYTANGGLNAPKFFLSE